MTLGAHSFLGFRGSAPAAPPGRAAKGARYLRPHNLASLTRHSFQLVWGHKYVLMSIYLPFAIALALLNSWYYLHRPDGWGVWPFLYVILGLLLLGPLAVAISDACLGWKPSLLRSFRRMLWKPLLVLLPCMALQYLLMFSGYIFLITLGADLVAEMDDFTGVVVTILVALLPMLFFGAWFMFVAPAVIIEHKGVFAAFGRSRRLGRGHYARHLQYFLSIAMFFATATLLSGTLIRRIDPPQGSWAPGMELIILTLAVLPGILLTPIVGTAFILMYYDLRVRKEGFAQVELDIRN